MIKRLCNFMFFTHEECKDQIHNLTLIKSDYEKKIRSLEYEMLGFINQIQELKAINNYQAWESEKKIAELEAQLKTCTDTKEEKDDESDVKRIG